MARRKQVAPMQRIDSGEVMQPLPKQPEKLAMYSNGHARKPGVVRATSNRKSTSPEAGILQFIICVGGIYTSFLTWALLQERITTTPFHAEPSSLRPAPAVEYFRFAVFLLAIQSFCAFISGTLYLLLTTKSDASLCPSSRAIPPLLLVATTSTLAAPFGYASLTHVDYLTYTLAKSCKLLPVMFLHIVLYQRRYPLSKYLIVLAVTAGVALFTLYNPPKAHSSPSKNASTSSYYGLTLLSINLLFDGLTNTTQDHIFASPHRYGRITSAQMMATTNLFSFLLMTAYLLLTPHIPLTLLPTFAQPATTHELSSALAFLTRHPSVRLDILLFSLCGAIGQLFIFATLERFSSLLLVTVTVTRKMATMILSVMWYGKTLTAGQWGGVALVFGGIATEAWVQKEEKKAKERARLQVAGGKES